MNNQVLVVTLVMALIVTFAAQSSGAFAKFGVVSHKNQSEQSDQSEQALRSGIAKAKKTNDPKHLNEICAVMDLVEYYISHKRLDEAAPLCKRARTTWTASFGASDRGLLRILEAQAQIAKGKNNSGELEQVLQQTVTVSSKSFGASSAITIGYTLQLADAYMSSNNNSKAAPLLKKVIAIGETYPEEVTTKELANARKHLSELSHKAVKA